MLTAGLSLESTQQYTLHVAGSAHTAPVLVSGFLSKCVCGEFIIHNTALNLLLPGKLYFKLGKSHNQESAITFYRHWSLLWREFWGPHPVCVFVCVVMVACTQSVT